MPDTDKPAKKPVHPNSLKNLLTIGAKYRYGGELEVRCFCGRRAVSGLTVCIKHGGAEKLRAEDKGSPRVKIHRTIRKDELAGQIPEGLAKHPVWQEVRRKAYTLADQAKDMLAAYRKMEATGDADDWSAVLTRLRDMGIG
jgi:hypothetical protein